MSAPAITNASGSFGGGSFKWNPTKNYKIGDLAIENGVLYLAKATSVNQSPSSDTTHTYWETILNTGNKSLVIKVVEQDLDAAGFSPVSDTLYQHVGSSDANFKINGLYYSTDDGYIDAFSVDAGGIFISYVSETSTAFPTTRADGSALKAEDYVKPASTATLPFTIGGITFTDKNDEAHYNGTSWYLKPASFKTANIGVTDPSTESLDGTKTSQSDINAEFAAAIKSSTARKISSDAAGNAFASHSALTSATKYYYAGAEVTPDKNDYAIVLADEDHDESQTRYTFQEGTPGTWSFDYVLNYGIADDSLVTTADGVKVQLLENGGINLQGIGTSKGLYISVASDGGIQLLNGNLAAKLDTNGGLSATADGIKITNSVTAETTGKGSATKTVTVKYDANGLITGVTENDIPTGDTTKVGLVQLIGTIDSSADDTKAATAKAVKDYVAEAIKHTFSDFSIPVANWTADTNTDLETNFKATVTATGATTSDMLQVFFALASLKAASECGILPEITAADTITFYAVEKPTAAISGKYEVLVSA